MFKGFIAWFIGEHHLEFNVSIKNNEAFLLNLENVKITINYLLPMNIERHLNELSTLNKILEILNQQVVFSTALQLALEELVKLLDLSTGWVFLEDSQKDMFWLAASTGLPPALAKNDHYCLREGGCTCQGRFGRGELDKGVNIVDCSRLEVPKVTKAV